MFIPMWLVILFVISLILSACSSSDEVPVPLTQKEKHENWVRYNVVCDLDDDDDYDDEVE